MCVILVHLLDIYNISSFYLNFLEKVNMMTVHELIQNIVMKTKQNIFS